MIRLRDYRKMNFNKPIRYEGDLEADYVQFLAKVQKTENLVDVAVSTQSDIERCDF